jgi:flap endonuclease-1
MGIKSLTQSIKTNAPNSITHDNLYKLSGKKVAVDASLVIYQNLLNIGKRPLFRNSQGMITNHITGLFYKIINYLSLNIELIFIFDGKPPDMKSDTILDRQKKSSDAKEKMKNATTQQDKDKYEKSSIRITKEMITNVKKLLDLLGVSYIHPNGEGEAYASELCRIGYVDFVLTEDMDTLACGCPKLIRNCLDKSLKRKDIISIFDYETIIEDFDITKDQFLEFCILCGCDYCPPVPKIGNISALKLIKQHENIENIINKTTYAFPENYLEKFLKSKEIFLMWKDTINVNEIIIHKSQRNISELLHFLVQEIEMDEKRVQSSIKKLTNIYK